MRRIEDGDHLALRLAGTHQTAVAAPAERQREGVEQDGFAGAGLARENSQPRAEIELQPVDQNDVAYRQMDQHENPSRLLIGEAEMTRSAQSDLLECL